MLQRKGRAGRVRDGFGAPWGTYIYISYHDISATLYFVTFLPALNWEISTTSQGHILLPP